MLIDELAYWINERERIREEKENGYPKPWSEDPVFQTTYFCNVHREDDKVTRWIKDNWRTFYPHPNTEFAMVMARLINWPPSLEILGFPAVWSMDGYLKRFQDIEGKKWGNAYVITTHGRKMPKDEFVFGMLAEIFPTVNRLRKLKTCEEAFEFLKKYDGLGSFLSAQVVADLKNIPNHPLSAAVDKYSFVAPGPGSLRGLSWFFDEKVTARNFHEKIEMAYRSTIPYVNRSVGTIDMQDFQNCLCEFDKYCRVRNGTGRSKRLYHGN